MRLTNLPAASEFDFWRELSRSRMAISGLFLLTLILSMAIAAKWIAPRDPQQTSTESFRPPSARFYFGTDDLGRDVFSGVAHGARLSLSIGLIVAMLSGIIGALIGLWSGYAGGLVDELLMRLTELFLIPPRFFLALVAAALFGSTFLALIVVLSITYWPLTARLVRAQVLSLKQRTFVEAARAIGASHARIMFREILPNVLPLIVTNITLMIGSVILVEAGLEFIGLGDTSQITWGYMLHNGQQFVRDAWWMLFFPTFALCLLVFALTVVGDALNRALDPRSRIGHFDKAA